MELYLSDIMLKVGLTGGIGSGKSTVAKIFETLGVPVYYADDAGKRLMTEDPRVRSQILDLFGPEAYLADGRLHRSWISARVFNNTPLLKQLEAIVHPAVLADGEAWMADRAAAPYVLREAALLFESGNYRSLDRVILVYAPAELRIQRVMQRDGADRKSVLARLERQWTDEQKWPLCQNHILNDGEKPLIPQVLAIHRELLGISQKQA